METYQVVSMRCLGYYESALRFLKPVSVSLLRQP